MVASGQLAPGTELPSIRELAVRHAINPMTVSKVYARLESEGVLERNRGKPMTVAAQRRRADRALDSARARSSPPLEQLVLAARQLELDARRRHRSVTNEMGEERCSNRTWSLAHSVSRSTASTCSTTSRSPWSPATSSACSARTARARRPCSSSCSASRRPAAARVEVFGHESYRLPGAAKARVGFVPQQDELINQLTARDQIGVIRSFYKTWDDALDRAAVVEMGRRSRRANQGHVGRPAAEAVDRARARPPARSADPRRARGEPRSARAASFPRADHRRGRGRPTVGRILVAHRVRHRAPREPDLDHQGRASALARRLRRSQKLRCSRARARGATPAPRLASCRTPYPSSTPIRT